MMHAVVHRCSSHLRCGCRRPGENCPTLWLRTKARGAHVALLRLCCRRRLEPSFRSLSTHLAVLIAQLKVCTVEEVKVMRCTSMPLYMASRLTSKRETFAFKLSDAYTFFMRSLIALHTVFDTVRAPTSLGSMGGIAVELGPKGRDPVNFISRIETALGRVRLPMGGLSSRHYAALLPKTASSMNISD
jgi:hypothetical protein